MKLSWAIPAAVCILLMTAWPFRWEKGPVQSEAEGKIVHMRDRWTGQAWVALYGVIDGQLLSGEMRPIPSQADIAGRKGQILARPEQVQKKQELEKQLAEYQRIMDTYEEEHERYYWFAEQEAKRRGEPYFSLGISLLATVGSRCEEYENAIPQEIIKAQMAWLDARRQVDACKSELYKLERQAETVAEAELKYLAWQKRNIATGVWGGLVALSALIAGTLFIRDLRSRDRSRDSVLHPPA